MFSHPTIDHAVCSLVGWQTESCGFGFDGWLLGTWNTIEQREFGTVLTRGGALASPVAGGAAGCLGGGDLGLAVELATGSQVAASAEAFPATQAIDGLQNTIWGAGDDAR